MIGMLRSLGLGRLAYRIWHQPRGWVINSVKHGGPLRQRATAAGIREMRRAAAELPPLTVEPEASLTPIHYLTGDQFWYQTAFCIWSYGRFAETIPMVVIHDDGSLRPEQADRLKNLIPGLEVVGYEQGYQRFNDLLPAQRFPHLNQQWGSYPNIRKLIGPHLMGEGRKLVLDSDMLFHARPEEMLDWQQGAQSVLLMQDAVTSYGYAMPVLNELAGADLQPLLNVGVTGLETALLDWEQIEHWCDRLISEHGASYYLEQALIAMLAAQHQTQVLAGESYRLESGKQPCQSGQLVLRHYVDRCKGAYFTQEWRHVRNKALTQGLPQ